MKLIRHGDVIFRPAELPETAKEVFKGTEFMAQAGETTGHRHMVRGAEFTVLMDGDTRYYSFPDTVKITHEEHKPLEIEHGVYVQVQEREKDWFSLSVRQVID